MASKRNTAVGQALSALAARQHGVVSRGQLRHLGLSEAAIQRAVDAGRLHRVFRGAYAVGHPRIGERGRLRAANLACGETAAISHRSAGGLLGLLDKGPVVTDVIAPPSRGRKIDGIRFHRVRPPRRDEVGTVVGIPCTSPARTLVDLAGTVGDWTLRSCFERAAQRKYLDIPAIEASMDPGRRGNRSLRALIDEWRGAAPIARKVRLESPLEVSPSIATAGATENSCAPATPRTSRCEPKRPRWPKPSPLISKARSREPILPPTCRVGGGIGSLLGGLPKTGDFSL